MRSVPAVCGLAILWIALSSPMATGPAAAQPEGQDALRGLGATEGAVPGESSEERRGGVPPRPVLAGPVDASAYVVGPGDVLSLEYGGRAAGSTALIVDGEGRIRLPSLGLVTVGGKTLAAARDEIVRRLRSFLPGAILDVRLLEPRTFKVFVLGEVQRPGVVEVVGSARVLEALEAAGGGSGTSSSRNIRVLRSDGRVVSADLDRFRRTGDWDANPYLADGDRVVVPVLVERIGVFGAVARPGSFEFRRGDSLGTAIRLAGGLLPMARLDSVLVLRFRGATELDTLHAALDVALSGPGAAILLEADDRIFVRPQPQWRPARHAIISGEVRFPGPYAIEEGKSRLSDLVRWAGGFTPQAALRNVRLERTQDGAQPVDVEFERLSRLSRGEMTNSEYQTFRSKLAIRQGAYLIDYSTGVPLPPEADVMLREGDHVDVGRLEMVVRVDGSVQHPGLIAYEAARTVSDYIRMAGGPSRRGNVGDARLTRAGTSATVFARDVRRPEPGDFIWVPEKKDTDLWAILRDAIIVTGQLATVVLVVDQLSK